MDQADNSPSHWPILMLPQGVTTTEYMPFEDAAERTQHHL